MKKSPLKTGLKTGIKKVAKPSPKVEKETKQMKAAKQGYGGC